MIARPELKNLLHYNRENVMIRILSLGAGVQSSTLALMAAAGEIGQPDCAIFADTGAEPQSVYRWLDWLEPRLPFLVRRVSSGNLKEEIIAAAAGRQRNDARPPFFIRNPDGSTGILRRQCTQDYKLDPIRKETRGLIGLRPRQHGPASPIVEMWIGISLDEAARMKPAKESWIRNRWPLVELRITRWECLRWLRRKGYPTPPRSACTFCPYHSNAEWRRLRDDEPEAWAEAVEVDRMIRTPGYVGLVGEAYLHRSLVPLDQVDLSTPEDHGQVSMFANECEGMCGV